MNITVIGGGPIGTYAASLISKKQGGVTLYEKKKEIGIPIQCTGILTEEIKNITKEKSFIQNKIFVARIYSPNNKFEVKFKKPNLIVNRYLFDQHFLNKAIDNETKIVYGSRFEKGIIKKTGQKPLRVKGILVGADGPLSEVSKNYSKQGFRKNEVYFGAQATVKIANDNAVDFYPHIGQYAWAVPEDEKYVRVGVATKIGESAPKLLKNFLKKYPGKIIDRQAGLIPIYNPQKKIALEIKNISAFLVGDSAAQIKNTTGGGLIPGLMAAEELTTSLNKNSEKSNKKLVQDYQKLCKKRIGQKLWVHYIVRKIMDRLSSKEWDDLIEDMNKSKEAFSENNRDQPIKMITKAVTKNPRLIKYAKHIIM